MLNHNLFNYQIPIRIILAPIFLRSTLNLLYSTLHHSITPNYQFDFSYFLQICRFIAMEDSEILSQKELDAAAALSVSL